MKKLILSKALVPLLVFSMLVPPAYAQEEDGLTVDAPSLTGAIEREGNLLKITTAEDFEAGASRDLVPSDVGNGALALAEGADTGVFYSAVYQVPEYDSLVASWNASLPDGASIEVSVRLYVEDADGGAWTGWMSYGEYGPGVYRGSTEDGDQYASIGVDTIDTSSGYTSRYIQMMAELNAGESGTPVLRQLAATTNSAPVYAETAVELPERVAVPAPAYSQLIRDPDIGGSICSPSTITVQLNSRDPELDLLPEELALSVQDFSYGFGNWSYCTSAAGLYGYEAYVQFADEDILMQELAQGRGVGISVQYSTDPGSSVYLEGAYGSTSGHLISLVGYYYEEGHEGEKDYLHFYSSDTYSASDATSYHDYKWTQLSDCWSNRVAYIIPSTTPEEGAEITGVTRAEAVLEPVEATENVYALTVDGEALDLTDFTVGKDTTFGRGVLAYTVEGFATDMATEMEASSSSIVYEAPMQMTANQTFYYRGIATTEDGLLSFDANAALAELGVPVGETRAVTVYAMTNDGMRYTASMTCTRTASGVVVDAFEGQSGFSATLSADDGTTTVTIAAADVEGDIQVGFLLPEGGDLEQASYYCGTEPFTGSFSGTGIGDEADVEGSTYAVFSFDPAEPTYHLAIDWHDGNGVQQYAVDLSEVISSDSGVQVSEGNLIQVDLSTGTLTGSAVRTEEGHVTLDGARGVYLSPVYSTSDWEYLMSTLGAVTPGASSAELMIRAKTEQGGWSGWYSWGSFGSGIASSSRPSQDDYVNMDTDVFCIRGSSAVANAGQMQLKVALTADSAGNVPTLFGLSVTYKKAPYDAGDAIYSGETAVEDLPASASVGTVATSAYSYAGDMASWRFENMMLMLLDTQGADLLFEEVALNGYDTNAGWGNWAYTIFKAGLFGYSAYTQYGATPVLIQQVIADGSAVGLYVNGGAIPTTNSSGNRQIVVYGYETGSDGVVTFHYICVSGDVSELESGAVYGTCTADELANAIESNTSDSVRGAMYVVGGQVLPSGVARVTAEAAPTDATHYVLSAGGSRLELPSGFTGQYTSIGHGGVIAYTLESESGEAPALAQRTFYYDADLDADGDLVIPAALAEKLADGDTATLFVIRNDSVTYVAELTAYQEPGEEPDEPEQPSESGDEDREVENSSTVVTRPGQSSGSGGESDIGDSETPLSPGTFTDVASDYWGKAAIDYVTGQGYFNGTSATTFSPSAPMTRAMLATVLWRMEGQPASTGACPFTDVPAGQWYTDAVTWAAEQGIVTGMGDGIFAPDGNITREQLATMLYRYDGGTAVAADLSRFSDAGSISSWAVEAMDWAVAGGVLSGDDTGRLAPGGAATRAEVAQMLYNYSQR